MKSSTVNGPKHKYYGHLDKIATTNQILSEQQQHIVIDRDSLTVLFNSRFLRHVKCSSSSICDGATTELWVCADSARTYRIT